MTDKYIRDEYNYPIIGEQNVCTWSPENFKWEPPFDDLRIFKYGDEVKDILMRWRKFVDELESKHLEPWMYMRKEYKWLYFLYCKTTNLVKIGKTEDVNKRLTVIQMTCPTRLQFLGSVYGHDKHERMLHLALHDLRRHGEWFEMTPFILDLIEKANESGIRPIHEFIERTFCPEHIELD